MPVYTESNVDQRPYLARLDQWLAGLGLRVVTLNRGDCPPDDRVPDYIGSDTFWIASLETSDADHYHAVVMRGSELYWTRKAPWISPAGRTCCIGCGR